MKIVITESQSKMIMESSYMGKYEGDMIRVGSFSRRKMPRPVQQNVLRAISSKVEGNASSSKLRDGVYDDIEITLFGQLLSYLRGDW
jgi:hypothetical protein